MFQEKYTLNSATSDYFSEEFDLIIMGLRDSYDERSLYVKNKLDKFKGDYIYLNTDELAQKLNCLVTDTNNNAIFNKINLLLIPDLRQILKRFNIAQKRICIDLTNLQHPIFFLLIKLFLTEMKPKSLFASYTVPKEYRKIEDVHISSSLEAEEFDLYERILGENYSIPGFSKISKNKKEILIAPIGFERHRLISLYENIQPNTVVPIVGFPSVHPGWNLTSLYMNYKVISDACSESLIEECDSVSPFSIFDLLKELYETYSEEYQILIAPLGSRPHSLGSAIFVTKHPNCQLVYDFPVEKLYRSNGINFANIYHLSNFIS